jgi:hypothetical protein
MPPTSPSLPHPADLPSDLLLEATELARRVNERLARITSSRSVSSVDSNEKSLKRVPSDAA